MDDIVVGNKGMVEMVIWAKVGEVSSLLGDILCKVFWIGSSSMEDVREETRTLLE